jgi:hypothetical protein
MNKSGPIKVAVIGLCWWGYGSPPAPRCGRHHSCHAAFPSRRADQACCCGAEVCGEAPYPITGKDFINNIIILEATVKSAARDGEVVKL